MARRDIAELHLLIREQSAKDGASLAPNGNKMRALSVIAVCASLALAACGTGNQIKVGSDGRPLPQVYKIDSAQEAIIPFRLLDSVNALRNAKGAAPLQFNAQLNAAAATHSRDMSVQNRPWHFGSDGSSPLDRVQRVGYTGRLVGENISETFETELETLSAWMAEADTRDIIMDPQAHEIGFAWFQEPSGKIWWTLVTGSEAGLGN